MEVGEAAKATSAATDRDLCASYLAGLLGIRNATPSTLDFQAKHLVCSFGLTEKHATIIAALAFGEVRA